MSPSATGGTGSRFGPRRPERCTPPSGRKAVRVIARPPGVAHLHDAPCGQVAACRTDTTRGMSATAAVVVAIAKGRRAFFAERHPAAGVTGQRGETGLTELPLSAAPAANEPRARISLPPAPAAPGGSRCRALRQERPAPLPRRRGSGRGPSGWRGSVPGRREAPLSAAGRRHRLETPRSRAKRLRCACRSPRLQIEHGGFPGGLGAVAGTISLHLAGGVPAREAGGALPLRVPRLSSLPGAPLPRRCPRWRSAGRAGAVRRGCF